MIRPKVAYTFCGAVAVLVLDFLIFSGSLRLSSENQLLSRMTFGPEEQARNLREAAERVDLLPPGQELLRTIDGAMEFLAVVTVFPAFSVTIATIAVLFADAVVPVKWLSPPPSALAARVRATITWIHGRMTRLLHRP